MHLEPSGDSLLQSKILGPLWASTHFMGVIIGSELYETELDLIRVFQVLVDNGQTVRVREDEASLELINAA